MRQMVIPRKGQSPASASAAADDGDTGDTADDDEGAEQPGDPEMVKCPKCGCVFDGEHHETDEPATADYAGKGDGEPKGADLDVLDSAEPTPGKFGTAHDAASGTSSLAALLGPLLGGR